MDPVNPNPRYGLIEIAIDAPDHHTITQDQENVSSIIIRSHAAAVCGVNVQEAIGANANNVLD